MSTKSGRREQDDSNEFRAAPETEQKNTSGGKIVHLPGNWSNPPGGNWSNPNGGLGMWSNPNGGFGLSSNPNAGLGIWSNPPGGPRLVGMGYHPDLPDYRDHSSQEFQKFLGKAKQSKNLLLNDRATRADGKLPEQYNLGDEAQHPLPPIDDQGRTNSCTAQAAASMMDYLYRWATGDYEDFSRLFIYFNSRRLLGWSGDVGAYIRTAFKSMRLFGAPPEKEWPFDVSLIDAGPQPYQYSYANNFRLLKYARLDDYGNKPGGQNNKSGKSDKNPESLFERVKHTIYSGFPVEFGFPVYSSIQNMKNFVIPVPSKTDQVLGGHAVLAVGYNENVAFNDDNGEEKNGVLIIRNSWGTDWGDQGYAFLPHWYLDGGYANDFWTAYDEKWLDLDQFGRK